MTNEQVKQLCEGIKQIRLEPEQFLDERQKTSWRSGTDAMRLAIVHYLYTRVSITKS